VNAVRNNHLLIGVNPFSKLRFKKLFGNSNFAPNAQQESSQT
jgi:hypothetical protein